MTELTDRIAGWLRSIDLDPGATRHSAVMGAAESLAKECGGRDVLDLCLLAHNQKAVNATNKVAEALRTQDQTWDVREGDKVAALTAATTAALAMEDEAGSAIPFALAIRSAAFCGLQSEVAELPDLALSGLVVASETLRERHPLTPGTPDLKGVFAEVEAMEAGTAVTSDDLKTLVTGVTGAFNKAVGISSKLAPIIDRRLGAAEEELNLLWWVIGESSELARTPFKDVSQDSISCLVGIEMSSLLREPCPLPSTRALLTRALGGRSSDKASITLAVPAICDLIGDSWVPHVEGHRLLPILSSAGEYRDLEGKSVWKESVTRWGITSDDESSGLDLAEQTVNELILARNLISTDE